MGLPRAVVLSASLILWLLLCPVFVHSDVEDVDKSQQVAVATEIPDAIVNLADDTAAKKDFSTSWLHLLDSDEASINKSVLSYGPHFPGDMAKALNVAGGNNGVSGVVGILIKSFIAIAAGLLVVFLLLKMLKPRMRILEELVPSNIEGLYKVAAGILFSLPQLISLILIAIVSTLVFLVIAGNVTTEGRMLFQLAIGILLIFKICKIVSDIIFSPGDSSIRPFPIDDSLVKPLHIAFSTALTILASTLLFIRCFRDLGVQAQTISWLAIIMGSTILAIITYLILYLRKPIEAFLLSEAEQENTNWLIQSFKKYWHLPALLYIAIFWFIWVGNESTGSALRSGSFVVSVLIAPIFFALSYIGKVLVFSVVDSLGLGKGQDTEGNVTIVEEQGSDSQPIANKANSFYQVLLIAVLVVWVLSLWGYNFPFAALAINAIFESLLVIALAVFFWRSASNYIEKKIADSTPEVDESEKDTDDEFGSAVQRGRSHTLLPMLRKAIGTFLIVMVVLIVISSLGVNIGPLLAGAGVFGIAIGFGAQKLVSDVLSGIFFLFDDAFRVGEYIQAGKTRGTVESITLRNTFLRHHLGMLQIVPHSDLGAITNFMRGGMVIKFPLEFPYDTDIDKVRKIIKKVGQAMLEDEELGDGFLQPVKSQGVHEISNSVMVIRVKFTAKPGQQFVIKREAFRRITEALNAKGIYYAHKKVLVDFPADSPHIGMDEETKKKALEAGAAAALTTAAALEEEKLAQAKKDQE